MSFEKPSPRNFCCEYHGRLERAERQMYMCAAEKVAEEKFSGEPVGARGGFREFRLFREFNVTC